MGITLAQGWPMAALVTITGVALIAFNARAVAGGQAGAMPVLALAASVFVFGLGARLLLDRDERDN